MRSAWKPRGISLGWGRGFLQSSLQQLSIRKLELHEQLGSRVSVRKGQLNPKDTASTSLEPQLPRTDWSGTCSGCYRHCVRLCAYEAPSCLSKKQFLRPFREGAA
jgi:hypothetical protein